MTASRNRRHCGESTGHSVYTVAGADLYTSQADPRRRAAPRHRRGRRDGSAVDETAVDLALLEMAANGTALDAGQASLVRQMCTSGHGCSWRSPPLAPGRRLPYAPSPWPGPKTAVRCSAWPRRLPRPPSSPSKPGSAATPSRNSPGRCSTATCPSGRPRSARRPC